MPGRPVKSGKNLILQYFDTKNTAGAKNRGCATSIKCEDLDGHVWDTVVNC